MSRPRALTERRIARLRPAPHGKRYDFPDGAVANLFVRVGAKQKVFVLSARFGGNANPTRRTIGVFPRISLEQARQIAREWTDLIERGLDPREEENRAEEASAMAARRTFRSAMEDYLAEITGRDRNRKAWEDIKSIRRHILNPVANPWQDKPMADVTDADVARLVKSIRNRAPSAAFATFRHFKTFFAWAMEPDRRMTYGLNANPIRDLSAKVLGLRHRVRKHMLSADGVRAYWQAAGETPYPYGPFYKGGLLSGVRRAEIAGMRWSEIDWESDLWTVPMERAKTDTDHLVPLSTQMRLLLEEIRRNQPASHGDFVFSTTNGQKPINGFGKAAAAFRARMAAALSQIRPGAIMEPWVLHDNRRVVRSALTALGVRPEVAETVLGHGKQGIEAVYNQYEYLPETRHALQRLADELDLVIKGVKNQFGHDVPDEARRTVAAEPALRQEARR